MPLRLNQKQLLEIIESIEDGGGDATALRRELEALGPEVKRTQTRRGLRVEEEEETTEERLNNRVGDLFPNGIPLQEIVDYDYRFTLEELRQHCRELGISISGDKKELAAKLIARNKGDNEDDRRFGRPEQAEGVVQ